MNTSSNEIPHIIKLSWPKSPGAPAPPTVPPPTLPPPPPPSLPPSLQTKAAIAVGRDQKIREVLLVITMTAASAHITTRAAATTADIATPAGAPAAATVIIAIAADAATTTAVSTATAAIPFHSSNDQQIFPHGDS